MIKAALLALLAVPAWADHTPPPEGSTSIETELAARAFLKRGPWRPMAEARWRREALPPDSVRPQSRELTLGSYYHLRRGLKLGAFWRLQAGMIHDNDWIVRDTDRFAAWEWEDTRARWEHVLVLDATPSWRGDFLPGGNWVVELKSRLLANTFNGHKTLKLRPGATKHLLRGGAPWLSLNFQLEFYIPFNYGESLFYETWLYSGLMWHASPRWKPSLTLAFRNVKWGTSDSWRTLINETYESSYKAILLGLAVNYYFED